MAPSTSRRLLAVGLCAPFLAAGGCMCIDHDAECQKPIHVYEVQHAEPVVLEPAPMILIDGAQPVPAVRY